jgi:hypothetical protein
LNLESLEKLFNIIENHEIYEKNLTQTEYSLLYEIFRRSKPCPKNKYFSDGIIYDCNNKPNYCYYGRNCLKGHHGFNGICSDDLYYNKCNCKNNLNEIKTLEEEISQINDKNVFSIDDYIDVNDYENKKNKIKQIKKKIEYLESTKLLHLNRDGYCTDSINYKNINNNFIINTIDTNIILNKMLEVNSCDDYNNYIINEKNKPSCYFVYNSSKSDFALDHNWSKEKWEQYLNYDKKLNLYLYFTFTNFQNISKTILPIYYNPLNDEKDWITFLINLNSKLCLINNFSNSIVLIKNNNKKLYSSKIDFILNNYIEIDDEFINNNNFNYVSYKSDISELSDFENESEYATEIETDYTNEVETDHTNEIETYYTNEVETYYTNEVETYYTNEVETEYATEIETDYTNEVETYYTNEVETDYTNEVETEYIIDNFNYASYKSDITEELEPEGDISIELKEHDIGYEKITLTKKEKYFISYDSVDSSINIGPITNYEFNLLKKKIKGQILNKKNINNVQVINIPIKINIANDIVNKFCEILNLKYSIIKNNTECEFLFSLDNM